MLAIGAEVEHCRPDPPTGSLALRLASDPRRAPIGFRARYLASA
jgi:hypothetical protein